MRTLRRSPPHVMLLHVNAINAATVGWALRGLRERGWEVVSPEQAFARAAR